MSEGSKETLLKCTLKQVGVWCKDSPKYLLGILCVYFILVYGWSAICSFVITVPWSIVPWWAYIGIECVASIFFYAMLLCMDRKVNDYHDKERWECVASAIIGVCIGFEVWIMTTSPLPDIAPKGTIMYNAWLVVMVVFCLIGAISARTISAYLSYLERKAKE